MSSVVSGKGYELTCELLSHVRNFKDWMGPHVPQPIQLLSATQGH